MEEPQQKKKSKNPMDAAKNLLGGKKEKTTLEELDECVTLTYKQRMYGFGCCFTLGVMVSLLAFLYWGDLVKFAVLYSIGNIIALCSTMFLMGPAKQVKRMFKKDRAAATVIYLLSIVMTLVFALALKDTFLTVLAMIIQFIALTWYALSYIPFARKAVKNCMAGMV